MANTTDDVKLGLQVLLNERIHLLDPHVPPMPFREDVYQNALRGNVRIGYFESIENLKTTDAMVRAVRIAKDALES
jgi:fatty acid amide hydrolase